MNLVRLIQMCLSETYSRVQAGNKEDSSKPGWLEIKWCTSAFGYYANILERSIHSVKKNTEVLVVASKEIKLEINAVETKYIFMSRDQNAG
jgi:hypothetical protein